jgi:hypothetical protein
MSIVLLLLSGVWTFHIITMLVRAYFYVLKDELKTI